MVFAEKGNGETEFMHDAEGNGHVNDTGEPVATGCGTGNDPNWLKVRKARNVFTVFCSRNGSDWTQVGAPTPIPSAAAVQDIGLFVVSHVAGSLATAEFTDWSLTEIDPGEEPGESDPPPSCAGVRSDEFDGAALDAARWTTVRGEPVVGGGSATLPITNGDIDGTNTGPISFLGQPAPSGAWTATTKLTLEQDNEWQYAGLLLHAGDDDYAKVAFTKHQDDARFFEFWSETGGVRTVHGPNVAVPAATGTTVWVRLASDGTQLTASYSLDGSAFTALGTGPLKAGATLGPVAAGDVDAANEAAAFDWFRVTPDAAPTDPGFDDGFDGDALDGCRWDRIKGWDSRNLALTDGALEVTTFDADISGADNGPIQNLVLQTPPDGDWTVETKLTAPLRDSWQLAGLLLHADDDHYVKYDVVADNAPGEAPVRRVELRYEDGGALTGPTGAGDDLPPPASATDTWWLRLTKTGDTYTGAISADGETWQETPGSVTVALDDPALGLMAIGPAQSDGPVEVAFDHIRLVGDEPVNAAPELTSATATPASGDAPLAVELAATATDADGDELTYTWDVDGDDAADATGPAVAHTYAAPGTYAAAVTVSDGTASDTATVRVTVAAPAAAPVPPAPDPPAAPPTSSAPPTPEEPDGPVVSSLGRPSLGDFRSRGLRVTLTCDAGGRATAALQVARRTARRLGLDERTLGDRRIRCTEGDPVTFRVKPGKAARRALEAERPRALRLTLRLALPGGGTLTRRVTLRRQTPPERRRRPTSSGAPPPNPGRPRACPPAASSRCSPPPRCSRRPPRPPPRTRRRSSWSRPPTSARRPTRRRSAPRSGAPTAARQRPAGVSSGRSRRSCAGSRRSGCRAPTSARRRSRASAAAARAGRPTVRPRACESARPISTGCRRSSPRSRAPTSAVPSSASPTAPPPAPRRRRSPCSARAGERTQPRPRSACASSRSARST